MGQYYKAVLIHADGTINTLNPHKYENGMKLLEHSYVGNNFVNTVLTQIWHNPTCIAWIGDYSDSREGDPYESIFSKDVFMNIYNTVWKGERDIRPDPRALLTIKNCRRYFVNHTKKVYIDMKEYVKQNKWHEEGEYFVRCKNGSRRKRKYSYDMAINPLPLLTACGNGRGGGDYHEGNPDYDKVGLWAFDIIEFTGHNPKGLGYQSVMFHFKE